MLIAKSTGDPQLSDEAERVHGFVRTIRPIAQVCVENFLVTFVVRDASLDSDCGMFQLNRSLVAGSSNGLM